MKLKEKLALEFTAQKGLDCQIEMGAETFLAYVNGKREGFLAGFDKAKEMMFEAHLKSGEPFYYNKMEIGEEEIDV